MQNIQKKYMLIALISLSVILLFGTSYALLRSARVGDVHYVLNAGNLEVIFEDDKTDKLNIENMYPMTDEEGISQKDELSFTIYNKGTIKTKYDIYMVETSTEPELKSEIRFSVNKNNQGYNSPKTFGEDKYIEYAGVINKSEEINYKVKIWLREGADSNYENKTFTAILKLEAYQRELIYDSIKNTLEEKPNTYVTDEDGTIYLSGTNDDINFNYVWYSGKLWRIMSLAGDGRVKLITEDFLTSMGYASTANFENSWVDQWLNQEFYQTLHNKEMIVDDKAVWDATIDATATPIKPVGTTTVIRPVGTFTAYEYFQSYQISTAVTAANTYLFNQCNTWTMTPATDANIRYISGSNGAFTNYTTSNGGPALIRPAIYLKTDVYKLKGDGSKENPYILENDIEAALPDAKLNTRISGEYVKFDNKLYRIVGTEKKLNKQTDASGNSTYTETSENTTKLIMVDYLRNNSGTLLNKRYSNTATTFGTGTTTDIYWDYYLNNIWYNNYISDKYRNMMTESIYYLGIGFKKNYKETICATFDDNISMSNCDDKLTGSSTWTGYVGMIRLGEMFSTQDVNSIDDATLFFSITPATTANVYAYKTNADMTSVAISGNPTYAARPTITLLPDVYIKSGTGTLDSPYEIDM